MSALDEVLEIARQDKLQNGYTFFNRRGILEESRAELLLLREVVSKKLPDIISDTMLRARNAELAYLRADNERLTEERDVARELLESINDYLSEDHARISGGKAYVYIKGQIGIWLDHNAPKDAQP